MMETNIGAKPAIMHEYAGKRNHAALQLFLSFLRGFVAKFCEIDTLKM
jgi:hypothetical protein